MAQSILHDRHAHGLRQSRIAATVKSLRSSRVIRHSAVVHVWFLSAAACIVYSACQKGEIRFGTTEYWDLPADQREGPRNEFVAGQERRARALFDHSKRIGTLEGEIVGRQYSLWSEWTRRIEDDPLATEEVLARWLRDLRRARKARRTAPRSVSELRAWLIDRQDDDIGSWAPPEAPLWLAVGETARALQLLDTNGEISELKHRLVFLYILQDPETAWESAQRLLEMGQRSPFPEAIRTYAWLPWLQWLTRDRIHWADHWRSAFRTHCTSEWLDPTSGGYPTEADGAMDLVTTYRLIAGLNAGTDIPAWIPAPQHMVRTVLAAADTLSRSFRPLAASLLIGSLADVDTLVRGEACEVLSVWHDEATQRLSRGLGELADLSWSIGLLSHTGPVDGPVHRWMEQFGCDMRADLGGGSTVFRSVVDQLHRMDDHDPVRLRMLVDCQRFTPMM